MAENVGSLYYDLTLNTAPLEGSLAAAEERVRNFGNRLSTFGSSLTQLGTTLSIAVTAPLVALGAFGVRSASQIQTAAKQMEILTGSAADTNRIIAELYNFVQGKPIKFPDAVKAAQTLAGYGVATEKVVPFMEALSRVSIATGANLEQLSLAFGQVNARGKLMGQDALQLINNNIPLTKVLAKELGISIEEAADKMQGGQISAEQFNKAMLDFANGLDISKASDTFDNRMISLQGSLRALAFTILGIKVDPVKGFVVEAGGLFDRLQHAVDGLIGKIREVKGWLASLPPDTQNMIVNLTLLAAAAGPVLVVLGALAGSIGNIVNLIATAAPLLGTSALALTGWGAVILAVVGALTFLELKFHAISGAISEMWSFVGPVLMPALQLLWNTIQTQLVPALQNLWAQVGPILTPALRILGGIVLTQLVAFILATTYALVGITYAISAVINWLASLVNWIRTSIAAWGQILGAAWNAVNSLFGLAGAAYNAGKALLEAFGRGIAAAAGGAISSARSVLDKIRNLLPHSDAKEGPLSDLTLSGQKLVETIAAGVRQANPALRDAMAQVLMQPNVALAAAPGQYAGMGGNTNIHIGTINDKSDADYILRRADRNTELTELGISPQ